MDLSVTKWVSAFADYERFGDDMKDNHPRLKRGFGSIKYLGEGRSNPYAVYPPEYELGGSGYLAYKKALCYVPDWYTGFAVLVSYKAGTYRPGDELRLAKMERDERQLSELAERIMRDYAYISQQNVGRPLSSVWDEFIEFRFGENAPKKFSKSLERQFRFARKNLDQLMEKDITSVKNINIQSVINDLSADFGKASLNAILAALKQVLGYAVDREYVRNNQASKVQIPDRAKDIESGVPFSREDLAIIFDLANKGDKEAITIVINCLSGFRYSAFKDMKVSIKDGYFYGGVKYGGKRYVPIHPYLYRFLPFKMYRASQSSEADKFHAFCRQHLSEDHTPHDCRHTFKALCDRFGVTPLAQRAMMGHSLGKDVHDQVYAHLDLEDLRKEIEKIDCGELLP